MNGTATIGDAVAEHLAHLGMPRDSGASARWVTVRFLGVPVAFPNFDARRAVLFTHDVHHLLTGYATTWTGEAEIGAFELRTGCGTLWAAWMFNSGGWLFGLFIAPRRLFAAFVRARSCTNFYRTPRDRVAALTVAAGRNALGLDRPAPPVSARDVLAFVLWSFGIVGFWVGLPLATLAVLITLAS
ncbi:MAG: hypothetical protein WAT39_11400 [Planctomycetota bacterium]